MKQRRSFALVLALLLALIVVIFFRTSPKRSHSQADTNDAGMTADLDGHHPDPLLNAQKNRIVAPASTTEMTPGDIIAIPPNGLLECGRRDRSTWSAAVSAYAHDQEQRGIRLTGYLVHAKRSGPESCNDYSKEDCDFHIWISDSPTDDKSQGVIVEITPRWRSLNTPMILHTLESLSREHVRVRVTGWLMWDEEHGNEVGRSRATEWEVHPVTNFEVLDGGGSRWGPLAMK